MSRKIIIDKYENNTHFTVSVIDSYNQEHHLGYFTHFDEEDVKELEENAKEIWSNEVEPEEDLLSNAIGEMIELDRENGIRNTGHLGAHRDGLD
tara:strand:- start:36 stop:317 length:282 start_codon:yes stop_codon:yes gene_type:complete